jgi:hypothetical protein
MPDLGNTAILSPTDASNNSGTMPSWSGSALPSTIDDAGRALQGAIAREWSWRNLTVTAGGTGNAATLTYTVAPAALYNGQTFCWIASATNSGATTLNINSLGATAVKKLIAGTATALSGGEIVSGYEYTVRYNSANTCFLLETIGARNLFVASEAQGDILVRTAAGWVRLAAGTSGQYLKTQGAGADPVWATVSAGLTQSSSVATTSGLSVGITTITGTPKLIMFHLNGVTTSGGVTIQIGSGSYTTSGYLAYGARIPNSANPATTNYTNGFGINMAASSTALYGVVTLSNTTGNTWAASYSLGALQGGSTNLNFTGGGTVALGGAIDRIQVTSTSGSDVFSAGSISVNYM